MSKRNSQEAKREARERLRAEREKQAKRERLRRQLIVAGSTVGVLGIGALVAVTINNATGGGSETNWDDVTAQVEEAQEAGDDQPYEIPEHAGGEDGMTVLVGDESAEDSILLFEEPRCGACANFDREVGPTVKDGIDNGDFTVEYTFATFFDDQGTGGTGSRNSVQALGAALDVSEEAFLEYLSALYSEEFHPDDNRINDFEDDDRLIEIAESVDALSDDLDGFEEALQDSRFAGWAVQMGNHYQEKAATHGVSGTPGVVVNGETEESAPQTPEEFLALLS